MRAPSAGWRLICSNSSGVSGSGFCRMSSASPILPMSWSSAPSRMTATSDSGSRSCRAMTTDGLADALRVACGVGVAGVERRGQRADGAQIGGARLRLGGRQAAHQLVEAGGQDVELAAVAGGLHRAAEVARRRHRRDGVRHAVDGIGQRPRQPQAGESPRARTPTARSCRAPRSALRVAAAPRRRSTTACRSARRRAPSASG